MALSDELQVRLMRQFGNAAGGEMIALLSVLDKHIMAEEAAEAKIEAASALPETTTGDWLIPKTPAQHKAEADAEVLATQEAQFRSEEDAKRRAKVQAGAELDRELVTFPSEAEAIRAGQRDRWFGFQQAPDGTVVPLHAEREGLSQERFGFRQLPDGTILSLDSVPPKPIVGEPLLPVTTAPLSDSGW
jgi:hypothetical protein